MTESTTKYANGVTVTDYGQPERLDGAQMQFMVTIEASHAFGKCLAYFGTREDADLFAVAKSAA